MTNTWISLTLILCCDGVDVIYNCGTTNISMFSNLQVAMHHSSWNPNGTWRRQDISLQWLDYGLIITIILADSQQGQEICAFSSVQNGSVDYPASYSMCKKGSFIQEWRERSMKLTTHPHLVQWFRMSGTIHPLPHKPSWHARNNYAVNWEQWHQVYIITGTTYQEIFLIYRVIHKSLRNFRTRLRNNQDRHGRKEHINR